MKIHGRNSKVRPTASRVGLAGKRHAGTKMHAKSSIVINQI